MKKLLLAVTLQFLTLGLFAQSEPFVDAIRKLAPGSTILDAAMLFKKDYHQFKLLAEEPTDIATIEDPANPDNPHKVQALYLVSHERSQLIQLYYFDDKLYQKAAYWYFEPGKVKEVEEKYAATLAYFKNDPLFIDKNKGFLDSKEITSETGRKTEFFLKKVAVEELRGECGYELVYSQEGGPRGFWVYMDGWNVRKLNLDADTELPEIDAPKGVLGEINNVLLGN